MSAPARKLEISKLSLDGLEALRLADLSGLYQEEAARRMGISRATYARILLAARQAVTEALVHGKHLRIGGGEVRNEPSRAWPCPIHGAAGRHGRDCHCTAQSRRPGKGRGRRPRPPKGAPRRRKG